MTHERYHLHEGIYGIILKENLILLVRKCRGPYRGMLDLPGGRSEEGETLEQTLIREILEETGVIVKQSAYFDSFSCRFVYQKDNEAIDFHHKARVYRIDRFDDSNLILDQIHEDVL